MKLLDAAQERMWACRRPERRQFLDSVRAELCDHAGLKWEKLTKIAGWPRTQQTSLDLERIESHGLMEFFTEAARQDHLLHAEWDRKMFPFFGGPKKGNEVWCVEKRYRAAILGACGLDATARRSGPGMGGSTRRRAFQASRGALDGMRLVLEIERRWPQSRF